jgi:hypothetical protein
MIINMMGIIVKYSEFYGQPAPADPISLLNSIPKEELIATISEVNAHLNPITASHLDDSRKTQFACIRVIFLDTENSLRNSFCPQILNRYSQFPKEYTLFTRSACLYAIQEVLAKNDFAPEAPEYNFDLREKIFKYLLAVNERIQSQNDNFHDNDHTELGEKFFEYFAFKLLPFNQYNYTINSINLLYKSWILFQNLKSDIFFGPHLTAYLKEQFGVEDMEDFFKKQMYTYFGSHDQKLCLNYINILPEETEQIKILDKLSQRNNLPVPADNDLNIFNFLEIKKSPLYRNHKEDSKDHITYVMLDSDFFLEKMYGLFINDFWFDYLAPNNFCTRNDWGNFIGGVFFEPFVEKIFIEAFNKHDRIIFRSTNQLKFTLPGTTEVEYADFYIRDKSNIILAEAKSNFLPANNGLKTVKDITDYRNLKMDDFYKNYGLKQLALKTVMKFHNYKTFIEDDQKILAKKIRIFPLLIVNDPILSSGTISFAFRLKFIEYLKDNNFDIENSDHQIMPLAIINVSELQQMEQSLHDREENIFNFLRYLYSITNPARMALEGNFVVLRTFEQVLAKHLKNKLIAQRVINLKKWFKK